MERTLFKDVLQLERSTYDVSVTIAADERGETHYYAIIDGIKTYELTLEEGKWVDKHNGVNDLSEAIGNLIEQKTV